MPIQAGFYDTPGQAYGVAVAGGYAYLIDSPYGLRIIDVSDPAAPAEAGFCDTPGTLWATGVTAAGSYAYIADTAHGLRIVDVSDPAAPFEAGSYATSGSAYAVAVSGPYALLADGEAGLLILQFPLYRAYLPLVVRSQ